MKYVTFIINERYYCYNVDIECDGHFVDSEWKEWAAVKGREYWTFSKAEDIPSHHINRCVKEYLSKEFQ